MNAQKQPLDSPFFPMFFLIFWPFSWCRVFHALQWKKGLYENSHVMTGWNASSSGSFYLSWKLLSCKKLAVFTESDFSASESKGIIFFTKSCIKPNKAEACQREEKKPHQTTQKTNRENKSKEALTAEADSNAGWMWVSHVRSAPCALQGAGQPHYSGGILPMLQLMCGGHSLPLCSMRKKSLFWNNIQYIASLSPKTTVSIQCRFLQEHGIGLCCSCPPSHSQDKSFRLKPAIQDYLCVIWSHCSVLNIISK